MITTKTKTRKLGVKSKKYKKYLQFKIKTNLGEYKKGFYKSKKQVLVVSYKQTKAHFGPNLI